MDKYILVNGEPKVEPNVLRWAEWMEVTDERRIMARTQVERVPGEEITTVSTVFLGIDHNFGEEGPPLLFETLIFGGPHAGDMWRYATKADALVGHEKAVAHVNGQEFGPREWSPRWKKEKCKEHANG